MRLARFGALVPQPVAPRTPWPQVLEATSTDAVSAVAASAEIWWVERGFEGANKIHCAPASQAAGLVPHELAACRLPNKYVGMPNYVGWLPMPSPAGRRSVVTESLNERWHYLDLAMAGGAHDFCAQPLMIKWSFGRGIRVHFPDALMECGGRVSLIDVTRRAKLEEPIALAVFLLTAATAATLGWDYELRVEMPAQRTLNLRFLWGSYWSTLLPPDGLPFEKFEGPFTVEHASQLLGGGSSGLSVVWKLLAQGVLHADLSQPLGPRTQLSRKPDRGERPWVIKI